MTNPSLSELDKKITAHVIENDKNFNLLNKVIFGDEELGNIGMKDKVDEMHGILTDIKGTGKVFNNLGTFIKILLLIAAVVAFMKGWIWGLITYLK